MCTYLRIIFYFIIFKIITGGQVGDECTPTENTSQGICKLVKDCDIVLRYIKQRGNHPYSKCGFSGDLEIVCCPTKIDTYQQTTGQSNNVGQDRYGQRSTLRVADRECQNIINSTIPPLLPLFYSVYTALLGEFPHMVALGYQYADGVKFQCGGSLISNTFVLTAAHCVDTLDHVLPSIARMGVADISDNGTDIIIKSIIKHPDYKRRTKYHDLALLELERPVEFSTNLHPICLFTEKNEPNVTLVSTSWGPVSTRDLRSRVLLKANLNIVPWNECLQFYTNWRKLPEGITNKQICADEPIGVGEACQGDSGGPLQVMTADEERFQLVGVTSFESGCGSPMPGVFTRIFYYLDWIESIVWPN